MSSTARKVDSEAYAHAQEVLREVRELVADQLHDLIVERQGVGSQSEVTERVQQIGRIAKKIREAQGRQIQAADLGAPIGPHRRAEMDGWALLRQTVASLAEACGSWCVALDIEARKASDPEL